MNLVTAPIRNYPRDIPVRLLPVDRQTLAKRRWRAKAEDGVDFGFDLAEPLRHGDVFFVSADHAYAIAQRPEKVLAIRVLSLPEAARVGWQVGNLHFPLAFEQDVVLAEDDSAIRQLLARERIAFEEKLAVFAPISPSPSSGHHHHGH